MKLGHSRGGIHNTNTPTVLIVYSDLSAAYGIRNAYTYNINLNH